jgi:hypothetical protein
MQPIRLKDAGIKVRLQIRATFETIPEGVVMDLARKSFWQEFGIVGLLESLKSHIMTGF